jgi:hypothetical protein
MHRLMYVKKRSRYPGNEISVEPQIRPEGCVEKNLARPENEPSNTITILTELQRLSVLNVLLHKIIFVITILNKLSTYHDLTHKGPYI